MSAQTRKEGGKKLKPKDTDSLVHLIGKETHPKKKVKEKEIQKK